MVDVSAQARAGGFQQEETAKAADNTGVVVEVSAAGEKSLAAYRSFCAGRVAAPGQHPVWVEAWIETANSDVVIVEVLRDGNPIVYLPLEIVRLGLFVIARYAGGSHANGNFPPADESAAPLRPADREAIVEAVRAARPDVDLIALERHNPGQDGRGNLLAPLATGRSPNISLAVDLSGGFDALLDRVSGKRKRRKFRLQLRKFEPLGGYRIVKAESAAEIDRQLSAFFEMKAARFKQLGIRDVFAPSEIRAFFSTLYHKSLGQPSPPFAIEALEVGGEIKAVHGQSFTAQGIVCDFGAISHGFHASPGFFLDYNNIQQACDDGRKIYDFSVGDEEYKRSWCELETEQFDCRWPVSAKGRLLHATLGLRAGLVRFVKQREQLWSVIKRLRAALKPRLKTSGD